MKLTYRFAVAFVTLTFAIGGAANSASAQGGSTRCAPRNSPTEDLLELDLESLLNVKVVTASKFSESQTEAPSVISVVGQDELRRFGGTTLREVLERVPGLASSTSSLTDRTIIAARGDQTKTNGGHVLFLINGRPTREVLEGGLVSDLLESFPINVLERIEVIKGPGSVLYGSNAFSAVVNLITKTGQANGFTVAGAPGALGGRHGSAEGTYTCGDLSIVGGAQVHQKPDWQTTYWFNNPIPDDPLAAGVPTIQDADIRDHSGGSFASLTYKGLSATSSFTEWQTAAFVRGTVGESHWKRGFADVGYSHKATDNWTTNVNVTYTRNLFAIHEFPFISRDSHETVLEWTNFVNPTLRDQLTFGALYSRMAGGETYYGLGFPLSISNGSRSQSASYAQLDHRLVRGVNLVGGFQANKIGDLSLDVVPRGGVIWRPAPALNVKALYGEAFRAPSINETTLDHPGLAGTPGLRPEKVATFDLELNYVGERIHTDVGFFRSRHTDSITVDTSGQRWRYTNLGEATFRGVEVEGKFYATKSLYLLGSFLHQVNEDGDGVENVTPVPNTSAKGGVSYQADRGYTLSVFDNYQGAINGFSSVLNPLPSPQHLLSGHLRLELAKLLNAPHSAGLALVINGDNMTNRSVWLPDWGGNTGDTIPVRSGRTLYVGVEMSVGRPRTGTGS
jgi:outer membrane receptor for ferrienterochelin and colicins